MIIFVESAQGIRVNVGAVREYRDLNDEIVRLTMDDGTTYDANIEKWKRALRAAKKTYIAAAPGTSALRPQLDETGQLCVLREPVVAWSLNQNGFATPVTCAGTCPLNEHFPAILHPVGTVDDSSTFYESYDDWAAVTRDELLKDWAALQEASIN